MYKAPAEKSESDHRIELLKNEFYNYLRRFLFQLGFSEEEVVQKLSQIQSGEISAKNPDLYRTNVLRDLRNEHLIEA
jgi:hypothetical protein